MRRPGYAAGTFLFLLLCGNAHADYAILHNGDTVFNVTVEDNAATASRPLRIRYKPSSFRYDYKTNSVDALLGHGDYYYIADYKRSSDEVSKAGARELISRMKWQRYVQPPPVLLTPFPRIARAAPETTAVETVDVSTTSGLADPLMPLDDRIQAQLEIFITEQRKLVDLIKYSISVGTLNREQAKAHRLFLLERQLKTLTEYYPQSNNLVVKAKEALENQIKAVQEKGQFTFEW